MSSVEYCLTPVPVQAAIDPGKASTMAYRCLTPERATSIDNTVFFTPKQVIIDSHQCPPPPRAGSQFFELFINPTVTQELHADEPLGFFLAAPCNSCSVASIPQIVQFKMSQSIKLLPKRSNYHSEDAYQGLSARTA